jgi:glycerol-3-phosphate dehydrogenase
VQAVETVATLMGGVLGWSQDDIQREIDAYTRRVEAERQSQQEPNDASADAARLAAPDLG